MSYTYEHPRLAVTVDVALFAAGGETEVVLIERGKPPFARTWALPGGFVGIEERLADAAGRELAEETGITGVALHFFGYFDAINRDPRGRTLSLAFWSAIAKDTAPLRADDDAADARWFPVTALPALAFDHHEIVEKALEAYRKARE